MRVICVVYISALLLSGCSINRVPFVYTPDLQQGSVINQSDVAELRRGMTRKQVRFLLGTPSMDDPFHDQRWDYVYYYVPGDDKQSERAHKHLSVFFENDSLVAAEGAYIVPSNPLYRRNG